MTHREHRAALAAGGLAVAVSLMSAGCAQRPAPGEEVGTCGPEYQIRARQLSPPGSEPGVATVEITTSDRYEIIPNIQVGLNSPSGRFYVEKLPRSFSYTDNRGKLQVEWHADAGGGAEPTVLNFAALDFPGECSVDLTVDPRR